MLFLLFMMLVGCSSGAVVFAPTPAPPDLSPLRYDHPTGAFSVTVPRHWPVFVQNTTTLAAASFSPPDSSPLLTFAVVRLPDADLATFIETYQSSLRADLSRYKEISRNAMGDGSWRLTGLRLDAGSQTQQINTFIEQHGPYIGLTEVILSDDPALMQQLQTIVNSFTIHDDSALEDAPSNVLVALAAHTLEIVNVNAWSTPAGVFFVTGEIMNHSAQPVAALPVRAVLYTENDLPIVEALDVPMGYVLPPGGFAPFSLRFGQGQPALATYYQVFIGDDQWDVTQAPTVYGTEALGWVDDAAINEDGALVITGTLTNTGTEPLQKPRVVATVFNQQQQVIAASFTDVTADVLHPNASTEFQLVVAELGGEPAQYILDVQALPIAQ